MVGITISLFVLCILCDLHAQVNVTFRLNMQPLIEKKLFAPEDSERIFVRGSFNKWKGDSYELLSEDTGKSYCGVFKLNAEYGDTLEYKFVIRKNYGRYYWERNPDPFNSDYGNRRIIVLSDSIVLREASFDYDEYIKYPVIFSQEKLREDFMQMREALEDNHPALYDYTSKNALDSLFDFCYSCLNTPLGFNEFYKILSTVLERIGCGHTKLWIPEDYWNSAPQKFFPLKLFFGSGNVYVSGYYSAKPDIPLGSEIISINSLPVGEIINSLASVTSSDAFIRAFKLKIVEKIFSAKYALYYGYPNNFEVRYIPPGVTGESFISLRPSEGEKINKGPARGHELSLKSSKIKGTSILTINTFIYYDKLDMFKSFIDSSFRAIKRERIKNLIIDLRGNDGGDPFCSSYLLSYIEKKPVPYFAQPYGRYEELAKPVKKAENNYKGNLFILIDGGGFSTTGHFCALLKYHKIGQFVGTETGATYTCTGSVRYLPLKNTRIILGTANKNRYDAAVKNMDRTRGILPDYNIEKTADDIILNKDTELNFVLDLIENGPE